MTSGPPERPEVPYPFPPWREPPTRTEPVSVPTVPLPSFDPAEQLFERRRVMVTGRLDAAAVSNVCAQLMALDGRSGDVVELVVSGDGGPVTELLPALDVIGLMRAPVDTTCTGLASGTAGVLVACGTGTRTAAPTSLLSLRCRETESASGSAQEIAQFAERLDMARKQLASAVARATGLSTTEAEAELDHGSHHDAEGAVALGLVDRVKGH